ncbi:MAG: A24 family peptidase [Acidimicrobiales bacterium]|nr:A24 family peptidase [Acidimicrobiales bacterium]
MDGLTLAACLVASLPAGWLAGVWTDRIPDRADKVFSPLAGVRLHGRHLVVHLVVIGVFAATALRLDDAPPLVLVAHLGFFTALVALSAIDLETFRLPDRLVVPSLIGSLVVVTAASLLDDAAAQIRSALVGAAVYFGLLLVVHLISPRGMGFGDVKLAAVMGLYLGWPAESYSTTLAIVLWGMLLGFVVGALVGVVMFVARGRKSRAIPFGPFLAGGCIAGVLFAPSLLPATTALWY